MGYRVPYLVGNKLWRDHTYRAPRTEAQIITSEGDADDYYRWPSHSFAKMMIMMWRVKKWTLSGTTHIFAFGTHSGFTSSADITNTWSDVSIELVANPIGFPGFASDERGHLGEYNTPPGGPGSGSSFDTDFYVLGNSGFLEDGTHGTTVASISSTSPSGFGDAGHGSGGTHSAGSTNFILMEVPLIIWEDHGSSLPTFRLPIRMSNSSGWAMGTGSLSRDVSVSVNIAQPSDSFSGGNLTISCPGIGTFTIPLVTRALDTWQIPPVYNGGTASFTLTAVEFWPYCDSSGVPVYDSTGASMDPLVDPFG